jgi:hypothetical protein
MSFVLGAVLFLLGGFFGMLIMAFAQSLPRQIQEQHDSFVSQLRLVVDDE